MFFVNFFLVPCIFALVTGDDYNWVPQTIPTVSQQCKMAGHYQGVCSSPGYDNPAICTKILCVEFTGRSYIGTPIDAMDGTICGVSSVCKKHECVPVPPTNLPEQRYGLLIRSCNSASSSAGD